MTVVQVHFADLEELVRDSMWLSSLECAGIDNSEAYDEAERVDDEEVAVQVRHYIVNDG